MRQRGFWPRLLLSVCVVFLLIGAWAPWASATQYVTGLSSSPYPAEGFNGLFVVLTSKFGFSRLLLDLPFAWDGLFLIGLALLFALWFYQAAPRRAIITLFTLTVGWLALTTGTLAVAAYGIFGLHLPLACGSGCPPNYTVISAPMWGFWLAWIATLGAWASVLLLLRQQLRSMPAVITTSQTTDTVQRSSLRWLAGASYSLGVLLWAVALVLLPWMVSGGCPTLDLTLDYVNGNCTAADIFDVDYPLIHPNIDALTLLRLVELLLLVGMIAVVVIWSRRGAIAVNTLAIVWLVIIAPLTGIAIVGVQTIIANTRHFSISQNPDWKFGIGVYLAIIGVVLCACGVALRIVPWRRRQGETQTGASAREATQAPG